MNRINISLSILVLGVLLVGLSSCEKYDKNIVGDVNIYLLEEYQTTISGAGILNSGQVLSDEPIISYEELLKYNSKSYKFNISQDAVPRIMDKMGSAFALTVDGEVIYTGYFWSSISSATVSWVVIDLLPAEFEREMYVKLGYPYLMDGWEIPDKRNDRRILSVFERDGKLVD